MNALPERIDEHWGALRDVLTIRNEADYNRAIDRLNALVDAVGDDERHPLYELLDTLGTLVHAYEETHYPMQPVTGAEALSFLMEEHGLRQSDLPEVGSQGVISELLSGRRELNVRQIRHLAERFHVSPAVFL